MGWSIKKVKAEPPKGSAFIISVILTSKNRKSTTKDIYLLSCGDKKNSFS